MVLARSATAALFPGRSRGRALSEDVGLLSVCPDVYLLFPFLQVNAHRPNSLTCSSVS